MCVSVSVVFSPGPEMKELVFHSLLHQLEDPEMANKAPFIFIWWEEGAEEKSVGLGECL